MNVLKGPEYTSDSCFDAQENISGGVLFFDKAGDCKFNLVKRGSTNIFKTIILRTAAQAIWATTFGSAQMIRSKSSTKDLIGLTFNTR